ncbi:MAG: phosphate acyltransferase PlsX [Candidatus Cloacimonadaceae bacterium]
MRIALDAFGSDRAPFPEVEGAVMAIKEELCQEVILVGDESILSAELSKYFHDPDRIKIHHASQRIGMGDDAAAGVRSKKDSSMLRTVELHRDGQADAAVSAGNTGAFMAASLMTYGRIKGVSRPAIAIIFPSQVNNEIILDVGANVDCNARNLLEFAHLGRIYYKYFFGTQEPRVSLLNIGEESAKGNSLSREAYKLLSESEELNFIGNIEGEDVLRGVTDVIVCDGFVGNVVLKTVEGALISIFDILKEQFDKDWIAKIGALLSYPVYSYLRKKFDHTEYGGALLVGLNGSSIVSHGRSNAKAIKNAIRAAAKIAESGFVKHCTDYFERF